MEVGWLTAESVCVLQRIEKSAQSSMNGVSEPFPRYSRTGNPNFFNLNLWNTKNKSLTVIEFILAVDILG